MKKHMFLRLMLVGSLALVEGVALPGPATGTVEADQSDVATLKPNGPHRFF